MFQVTVFESWPKPLYPCAIVTLWFRLRAGKAEHHGGFRFAATLQLQTFVPKRPFSSFSYWEIGTLWQKVTKAWDERQPKEDCEPRSWHLPESAQLVVSQEWHRPNQRFHQWDVPPHYLGHLNTTSWHDAKTMPMPGKSNTTTGKNTNDTNTVLHNHNKILRSLNIRVLVQAQTLQQDATSTPRCN